MQQRKLASSSSSFLQFRRAVLIRFTLFPAFVLFYAVAVIADAARYAFPAPASHPQADVRESAPQEKALFPEPGKPLKINIADRATSFFHINLNEGQFLHVVVEQEGINVSVALFDTDGLQLFEADGTSSTQGEEALYFLAKIKGTYKLKIEPPEPAPGGSYRLLVKEIRDASAQDRLRASGTLAAARGDQLRKQRKWQEAIESYSRALSIWNQLNESREAAKAFYNTGKAYARMEKSSKALENYHQSLPLMQSHGTQEELASILLNIGVSTLDIGESYTALTYYQQALNSFNLLKISRGEAFTLSEIGRAYYLLGENQEALNYYDKALAIWRGIDKLSEAFTLDLIGRALFAVGQMEEALEMYRAALSIQEQLSDERNKAYTLTDIGRYYLAVGDGQNALLNLERALLLHEKNESATGRAETLAYIGEAKLLQKQYSDALRYLQQALPLQKQNSDPLGQGDTLHKIGVTYFAAGDPSRALKELREALSFWQANQFPPGEALTRYELSRVLSAQGDTQSAREEIEKTISIVESQRAKVLSRRLRSSYFASVQNFYEQYIAVLMQLHQRNPQEKFDSLALNVKERAKARALLDSLAEAQQNIREGIDPALLAEESRLRQQLSSSVDLQIRLLSDRLLPEQAAKLKADLIKIEEKYRAVEDRIRLLHPRYTQLTAPRILTVREIQSQVLDEDTLLLEYSLGEQRSYLWVISNTEAHSFELPGRAEIESLARPFRELMSRRNQLAADSSKAEELAKELGRTLLGRAAGLLGEKRLLIVGDGVLQFIPFAALQIPRDASQKRGEPAQETPCASPCFEPLIASHEILYEISASTIAAMRREGAGRRAAPMAVAIIADPVFSHRSGRKAQPRVPPQNQLRRDGGRRDGFSPNLSDPEKAILSANKTELMPRGAPIPPLLFSDKEAKEIYEITKREGAMLALGFKANQEIATSPQVNRYRIIHFSTHALLNNDHPDLSGIVLSLVNERGVPQDGFLQLYEIYNLKLQADLVVLSACQTAIGRDVKGEGMLSLTRGFMYAGSQRVAATLWEVDDEATTELMRRFYQNMFRAPRLSPAAALRQAQLSMRERKDRWSNPFYWAGFIVQGEWRDNTL